MSLENIQVQHIEIVISMLNEITKFLFFFHDLKNYDYHLIMQKLSKFNLKINDMPNGLGKYMSISNRLGFIDGFQFLSSLLDSLVKNSSKDDVMYLSIVFDNDVLALVKLKIYYPQEYISDFIMFEEELPNKEKFYSFLIGKKISDKEYVRVLKFWNKFKMKTIKH